MKQYRSMLGCKQLLSWSFLGVDVIIISLVSSISRLFPHFQLNIAIDSLAPMALLIYSFSSQTPKHACTHSHRPTCMRYSWKVSNNQLLSDYFGFLFLGAFVIEILLIRRKQFFFFFFKVNQEFHCSRRLLVWSWNWSIFLSCCEMNCLWKVRWRLLPFDGERLL